MCSAGIAWKNDQTTTMNVESESEHVFERTLWSTQAPRVTEYQCLDAKAETRSSCCGRDTILVRDLHIASHRFISKNSLTSKTVWMQRVNSDLIVEMCDACHRRQEKVDVGRAVSKSSKIRLQFLQKHVFSSATNLSVPEGFCT